VSSTFQIDRAQAGRRKHASQRLRANISDEVPCEGRGHWLRTDDSVRNAFGQRRMDGIVSSSMLAMARDFRAEARHASDCARNGAHQNSVRRANYYAVATMRSAPVSRMPVGIPAATAASSPAHTRPLGATSAPATSAAAAPRRSRRAADRRRACQVPVAKTQLGRSSIFQRAHNLSLGHGPCTRRELGTRSHFQVGPIGA
jgi:hypothetical protein